MRLQTHVCRCKDAHLGAPGLLRAQALLLGRCAALRREGRFAEAAAAAREASAAAPGSAAAALQLGAACAELGRYAEARRHLDRAAAAARRGGRPRVWGAPGAGRACAPRPGEVIAAATSSPRLGFGRSVGAGFGFPIGGFGLSLPNDGQTSVKSGRCWPFSPILSSCQLRPNLAKLGQMLAELGQRRDTVAKIHRCWWNIAKCWSAISPSLPNWGPNRLVVVELAPSPSSWGNCSAIGRQLFGNF